LTNRAESESMGKKNNDLIRKRSIDRMKKNVDYKP